MQIVILALGTQGDFELFLTLARELRCRGHQVVFASSEFYSAKVRDAGLRWTQVGNGARTDLVSVLHSLSSVSDKTKRTYLYYKKWLQPQLSMAMDHVTSLAAGADYFISNLKMVLQRGEKILPGASVTYDPPGAIEDLEKYGTQKYQGRILDLVAMNKKLIDPQDLWGKNYRFTGFWKDTRQAAWKPPAALMEFLRDGPPPVVITMGSMLMFDSHKLLRDLSQALRLADQRAIIVGGWSDISRADALPASVYCAREIPYDWLFPKAACVIHHGGCGTISAVLRAGKPSILLPQIACQEQFGRILLKENLATGMFDVSVLDPGDVAAAIRRAVTDQHVSQSAKYWQREVSEEEGVARAVDLIEAHWRHQLGQSLITGRDVSLSPR
jgi:UDP:flavonoid glycosyltransferase YjiC (YdhE family)